MNTKSVSALVVLATFAIAGCAAGGPDASDGSPAQEQEKALEGDEARPLGAQLQGNESVNCKGSGDTLECTNRQERPAGYHGYVMADGLSSYKNEKVKITNTGSVRFTAASVQGLNVIRQQKELAPGESVTLERIDLWTPLYGTIIFTDAARDTVHAKAEVIR